MLEKNGDTGPMLAASTQGLDQWKVSGPPPIKSMYLEMKDMELAAALNLAEIRGLDDISFSFGKLNQLLSQLNQLYLRNLINWQHCLLVAKAWF